MNDEVKTVLREKINNILHVDGTKIRALDIIDSLSQETLKVVLSYLIGISEK